MQEGTGTHGLKRIYIEFVISEVTTNKKAMFYKQIRGIQTSLRAGLKQHPDTSRKSVEAYCIFFWSDRKRTFIHEVFIRKQFTIEYIRSVWSLQSLFIDHKQIYILETKTNIVHCILNILEHFMWIGSFFFKQEPICNLFISLYCRQKKKKTEKFLLITALPSGQMMQYFLHYLTSPRIKFHVIKELLRYDLTAS